MTIMTIRPAEFGDADLALALESEDFMQNAGLLAGLDRKTCRDCRVWAGPAHLDSDAHWAVVSAAICEAGDAAAVTIPVAVSDAARLRWFDQLTATALAAGTGGGLGWAAAQTPVFSTAAEMMPVDLLLAGAAGLLGAAAATIARTAVRNWRAGRPNATILALHDSVAQAKAALAPASTSGPGLRKAALPRYVTLPRPAVALPPGGDAEHGEAGEVSR